MHNSLPQFQMQKIPQDLDLRLRKNFERKSTWEQFGEAFRLRSIVWPSLCVSTFFAFALISQHGDVYAEEQLWAAVFEADIQNELRFREGIAHQKFVVHEGQGKPEVVALVNGLSVEQVSQVVQRSDTVEIFSHDINTLVKSEKNINLDPTHITLNLKSKDHLHVFETFSTDCQLSKDCASLTLTKEGIAHRALFDSVHNIASDYDQFANPKLQKGFSVLPKMKLIEHTDREIIFRNTIDEKTYVDYYFDPKSLERKKEVIFAVYNGVWYEMAQKNYVQRDVISATEFATIFDPEAYELKQKKVIPL